MITYNQFSKTIKQTENLADMSGSDMADLFIELGNQLGIWDEFTNLGSQTIKAHNVIIAKCNEARGIKNGKG